MTENDSPLRLNLGCGADRRAGYVNVDLYTPADIKDDIVKLWKFRAGSAAEIYAAHCLEHLSRLEGQQAVARWCEVLQPGGELTVIVPDVVFNLRLFLEAYDKGTPDPWGFRAETIWGNQNHGGEFHRWGYDSRQLFRMLDAAGFTDIVISKVPGLDFDFGGFDDSCYQAKAWRPA